MTTFNYDVVAELFAAGDVVALLAAKPRRVRRQPTGYGRFARAAYAIRFAIEELPADLLSDTCLRVDQQTFDGDGIRQLYESQSYPLARRIRPTEHPASNVLLWKRRRQ